jgi:hypothetical protein
MPPPAGYSIRAAKNGELGPTELGSTNSEAKTIKIDLGKLANELIDSQGSDVEEFVGLSEVILIHDCGHTPDYGTPFAPSAPGYGNDPCQHEALYGDAIDWLCELIEQRQGEGGTTETLCKLSHTSCGIHNAIWCLPPPPKKVLLLCMHLRRVE